MDARKEVEEIVLEHLRRGLEHFGTTHRLTGYRSGRPPVARKWRVAALVGLALVVAVTGGLAATREGEPVTALSLTAPDGTEVTLSVQDAAPGLLCLDLEVGDETITDTACGEPPVITADELSPITVRTQGLTIVYGTVRAATRRSSADLACLRTSAPACPRWQPRAYNGRHEGEVRFYGMVVGGEQAVGSITLRDRTRAATAATDIERAALPLAGKVRRVAKDRGLQPQAEHALRARAQGARQPWTAARPGRRTALCAATVSELAAGRRTSCAIARKRRQLTMREAARHPHIVHLRGRPGVDRVGHRRLRRQGPGGARGPPGAGQRPTARA